MVGLMAMRVPMAAVVLSQAAELSGVLRLGHMAAGTAASQPP